MAESFVNSVTRAVGVVTSSSAGSVGVQTNLITGITTTNVSVADIVQNGNIIAEDSPQGLIKATGNTTATLEDSFIYFNSLDKNNDLQ